MKKPLSLILILLFAVGICSCGKANIQKRSAVFYDYFDTVTILSAYGATEDEFTAAKAEVEGILKEYHRLTDIYNEYEGVNNLYTVNQNAGQWVKVDKKLVDFLLFAKEMYTLTDGNVNIAFGGVTSLWHTCRTETKALPDAAALTEAAAHCDIEGLLIDEQSSAVMLSDKNMSLDAGALAKGYACEKIGEYLDVLSGSYAVSMGGNLRVNGKKTEDEYWTAGIQNPDLTSSETYLATVNLEKHSLVTSGDYMRYFTVDGKNYHHIISPKTLYPAEYFCSVSVLCQSSAQADALSTALFNMSLDEGKALLKALPDTYVMWVTKDGQIHCSDGFEEYICE